MVVTPREKGTERRQLPDEVASYVRELIISGAVRPGEFLRMEPIADAVGVSNTPVREGLLTLRSEGFVHLAPRRGFVVAHITAQDIRDIFWAQAQLAGELAARAARKIGPVQLGRLEANIEQYQRVISGAELGDITVLGHEFHREVNLAADSNRLALLLGSVVKQLPNTFYTAIEGQVEDARGEHPKMLDALGARNARTARVLMQQHIIEGADRLIDMLDKRGFWTAQ